MRGKSPTCREALTDLAVYDRGSKTLRKKKDSLPASRRLAAHRRGQARCQAASL